MSALITEQVTMPAAMNGMGKSKKMANHYEDESPSGSVAISAEDEVSVSVADAAEDQIKAFVSVAVSANDEASVSVVIAVSAVFPPPPPTETKEVQVEGMGMESDKLEDETVEVMRSSLTAAQTKRMRGSVRSKKVNGVRNKRRKANTVRGNFSTYIYRVLKFVHPGSSSDYSAFIKSFNDLSTECTISSRAMSVINSISNDIFHRLASEAGRLTVINKKATLQSNDIQTATWLLIRTDSLVDIRNKCVINTFLSFMSDFLI